MHVLDDSALWRPYSALENKQTLEQFVKIVSGKVDDVCTAAEIPLDEQAWTGLPGLERLVPPSPIHEEVVLHLTSANVERTLEYRNGPQVWVQLQGETSVVAIPPESMPNLHVFPSTSPLARHSQVTAHFNHSIDVSRYPQFSKANTFFAILRPGHALMIPPRWSIATKSLPSSSLNSLISIYSESSVYGPATLVSAFDWSGLIDAQADADSRQAQFATSLAFLDHHLVSYNLTTSHLIPSLLAERYAPLGLLRKSDEEGGCVIRASDSKTSSFADKLQNDELTNALKSYSHHAGAVLEEAIKDVLEHLAARAGFSAPARLLACFGAS